MRCNMKVKLEKHKKAILFWLIMLFAFVIRIWLFGSHPAGLNQDEASIGYDAWSILNYGIDRNGFSFPVHLMAWGSGQNALYAYLSMPFIAIFGLNVVTIRLVNLIFSLLTVAAVYSIGKQLYGARAGFAAMALTAASPWNIMLARWGLESNLYPALLTLAIWALLKTLSNKSYLYLAAIILAVSMYSYGSAYLVNTVLGLACFVFIIVKKIVPLKTVLIAGLIFLVISAPIYAFMIINVFGLEGMQIGFISIPRLYGNRISAQSGTTFIDFFKNIYQLVIFQTDGYERNAFAFYGCIYVISMPFWVYGIVKCVKRHKPSDLLILLSFVCSIILFAYYNGPNINRVNSLYMPLIILTAVGLNDFLCSKKKIAALVATYTICLCGFTFRYFSTEYKTAIGNEFFQGFGEAIQQAERMRSEGEDIYVDTGVNMPYIYALFYTQTPPQEFTATVQYENPGSMFQRVRSFTHFEFNSGASYTQDNGLFIVESSRANEFFGAGEIYKYGNYAVIRQ